MRALVIVAVIVFGLLQYTLWFGHGGVISAWKLRRAVEAQQAENDRLTERNRALTAQVEDLKHGLAAVEEVARTELGMVSKDEVFYLLADEETP